MEKGISMLRQQSCCVNTHLDKTLQQYLPQLNIDEKNKVLTQCAMLAAKHGILSNVKILVEQNPDILHQQQCGIFRMCAEIEHEEQFKCVIDYLLDTDKKHLINVNALESGFLRECIKRDKLDYIKYLIEDKNVTFDIENTTLIKTLLRYENDNILNYFIVDLKIPINIENVKNYMLENNHTEIFNKMNKCNMFIKLGKKLQNKNMSIKVNKI